MKLLMIFVWFLLYLSKTLSYELNQFCGQTFVREALQPCNEATESKGVNDEVIIVGNLCEVKRFKRKCCDGWTGKNCQFPTCRIPCKNGGVCVAPNKCQCDPKFSGSDCSLKLADEKPCNERCIRGKCKNGICICDTGYDGERCDKAFCKGGCGTGICTEPNVCQCPENFRGNNCETFFREPSLSNLKISDIINTKYKDYQICSVMGGSYVTTFDGVSINDPLRGSNILVIDCLNRQPNYQIYFNSSYNCATRNFINCDGSLLIQTPSESVTFTGLSNSSTNTNRNYVSSIQHKNIGDFNHIRGVGELEILYDGKRNVFIFAPATMKKSVCGMCGYFDGNNTIQSEFRNINGESIENATEFLKYWKNPDPSDTNTYPSYDDNICNGLSKDLLTTANNICQDVLGGDLTLCPNSDRVPYLSICQRELCNCLRSGQNISTCAKIPCSMGGFKSYHCTLNGKLINWRTQLCPSRECPANKEYSECGNSCSQNCEDLLSDENCKYFCTSGCFCPKDRLWNGTYCVPKPQCPCIRKNGNSMVVYHQGMSFKRDCEICECSKGGVFICAKIKGCSGTCVVSGDPHYTTFDKRHIYVEGACSYTMISTKSTLTGSQAIKIWVQNTHCMKSKDVYCTKSLSIQFGDTNKNTTIQLKSIHDILVNGIPDKLPLQLNDPLPVTIHEVAHETVLIESYNGIRVLWHSKTQFEITLPEFYQDQVQGLCGNYNGNSEDDATKSSGELTTNDNELAISWSTSDCKNTEKLNYLGACAKSFEYEKFVKEFCQKLLMEPFNSCHMSVDPNSFIQQCKHDICLCGGNAKDNCGCESMASYSRACMKNGIVLPWRTDSLCDPKCPPGMEYKQCKNLCAVSCFSITQTNCSTECIDGCQCKNKMVYDTVVNRCVNISQCQCTYENVNYVSGSSRKDKCNECICTDGIWACTKKDCSNVTFCPPGMIWKNCGQCDQTCENQDGLCLEKECKSGCFCPEGYLISNKTCVPKHKCPCLWSDKSYSNRSLIYTGPTNCLSKCICNEGKWACEQEKKCVGSCKSWGDAHYKTFDGKYFDFVSKCSYTMVENDCGKGSGFFKLETENIKCGNKGTSCTKSILFYYKNLVVRLLRGVKPIVNENENYSKDRTRGTLSFRDLVSQIIIYTDNDIVLYWDKGLSIEIVLPPEFQNQVCGLCGNFDHNLNNDLK